MENYKRIMMGMEHIPALNFLVLLSILASTITLEKFRETLDIGNQPSHFT